MSSAEPSSRDDLLDRIDRGVAKGEAALLVVTVAVMIGLSLLQFVLRKSFDFGFEWADIVVRQMVLWLAFIGGALATHEGRHIAIDAASKLLPPRRAALLAAITSVAAAIVCAILVRAAWLYLKSEIESGTALFGDIPAWPFEGIIPVAFAVIVFHFLVSARHQALVAFGRRTPRTEGTEPGTEKAT